MKKKKGKRKISVLKVLIVFLICYLLCTLIYGIVTVRVKNIYVIGNSYLSDKYIINASSLNNYPPFFLTSSKKIEKRLKDDVMIYDVSVKKGLFSVYLYVTENVPLFYSTSLNKYVLKDGSSTSGEYNVSTLVNYVPDTIYDDFINKMGNVTVIDRISEIEYKPNDVDSKRFYLLMNDGNQVYLTLDDFLKINDYVEILKTLNGKKGIMYLDYGNYFVEK